MIRTSNTVARLACLSGLIAIHSASTPSHAAAVGTAFTYQGELLDGGAPMTGDCDFEFTLWDDPAAGVAVGPVVAGTIELTEGKFTTVLDFGAGALSGATRWLEIDVCCPSPCSPTFTTLSPRQELTPSPHAVRAVDGVGPPNALEVDAVNGRVGIGTSAPVQPLHVVGTIMAENPGSSPLGSTVRLGAPSADPGLAIQRGDGAGGVAQQWDIAVEFNDTLEIRDFTAGGAERLVIDNTGRVGIGTNTPGESLDVSGNIHASGTIASGDSITIDGTAGLERIVSSDAMEIHTSTGRVLRMEPDAADVDDEFVAPNLLAGWGQNSVTAGVVGATISGGGASDDGNPFPNVVTDDLGTIGGGYGNQAGDNIISTNNSRAATVGGGSWNVAAGHKSTVGGGHNNQATQAHATVAGGVGNSATSGSAVVGGGGNNDATGTESTVSGGGSNTASGNHASIPGGEQNLAGGHYSLAAGRRAKARDAAGSGDADGDEGTFVWADSTNADFVSTGPNQFLIRANNGVGINTNAPAEALDVTGNIHASGTIVSGNSIVVDGSSGSERITSSNALEIHTSSGRIIRLEPNTDADVPTFPTGTAPNVITGWDGNSVTSGVGGATIAGGGFEGDFPVSSAPNRVTDHFGTIGGGRLNLAGDDAGTTSDAAHATVGGGYNNRAMGRAGTVSGGQYNTASFLVATVGGGHNNMANGSAATVGGGQLNAASGDESTIGGGGSNIASAANATVGGGDDNDATGSYSTVPGGLSNLAGGSYSFAAGRFARVRDAATVGDSDGDNGTFVWADSTASSFISTGPNQFLIRAAGGVGINTNDPDVELEIAGGTELSLTDNSGWMMIGDQDSANLAFDTNEIQARSDGSAAALALNPAGGDVNIAASGALTLVNGTLRVGTDTLYADPSTEFVGLNTTSPTERLHVVGNIVYTGTITDISDERLKSNIAPVEDARKKLRQLRGVYFTMNDTPDQRDVGLIAQDVQAVLPEAVRIVDREHGHLGVSYPSVIPLLVEAIKDQDELIDERDRRIVELERHNTSMESRLERMEQVIRTLEARMEGGAE